MKIAGVILAGGQASRMGGGDKCLLTLDKMSLLEHVITRLKGQVDAMVLNANGDPARFSRFDLPVVSDSVDGFAGPLAGVLAGMDWAHENGYTRLVSVAADTPFFPAQLVTGLQLACEGDGTTQSMAMTPDPVRKFARHPTFGLWDVSLRGDLRAALQNGVRKVIQWTEPHGCAKMVFDGFDYEPFFNVNTPDDLAIARAMLKDIT